MSHYTPDQIILNLRQEQHRENAVYGDMAYPLTGEAADLIEKLIADQMTIEEARSIALKYAEMNGGPNSMCVLLAFPAEVLRAVAVWQENDDKEDK
jgi:hypothetical protein